MASGPTHGHFGLHTDITKQSCQYRVDLDRLASVARKVDGDRRNGDKEWTRVNQQVYKVEAKEAYRYSESFLFESSLWVHKKRSHIYTQNLLRRSVSTSSITMGDKLAQSFDQQIRHRITAGSPNDGLVWKNGLLPFFFSALSLSSRPRPHQPLPHLFAPRSRSLTGRDGLLMRWIGCEGVCGKMGFFTIRFNLDSTKQISKDGRPRSWPLSL